MRLPKIPLLVIIDPKTSKEVWTGRLDKTPTHLYEALQLSLYDDEEPELYLAELFLGTDEDLDNAISCGSHPAKYLQDHCEELYHGDYIEVKFSDKAA